MVESSGFLSRDIESDGVPKVGVERACLVR